MSIVRLTNADKYYNRGKSNEIHVIDNISLELPESGMVAIFGRSGCGKTTLLNAIGGLDKTSGGSIEVLGESISGGSDNTDAVRNRYIGYIFQNYNLNVNETVYENVADALLLCGIGTRARYMTALWRRFQTSEWINTATARRTLFRAVSSSGLLSPAP